MSDTFYPIAAHVTKKNVTIKYTNIKLNIDVNNLKFSLKGSSEKLSLSINQFKNRKCKGGGKYVTLQGETGEINSVKLEFRDNDPELIHVSECFNMMFDKYKSMSVGGSKPQKRILEHEPQKQTVPCNLIKNAWSRCSSENSNSQQSDVINSPAMKELFPMDSVKKQATPLVLPLTKSPLKSRNETVSKLNQTGQFSENRKNATPSYSAPNVSTYKPSTPQLPKSATCKTPTPVESPRSRPSKITAKRPRYIDLSHDDDLTVTTPTRYQNSNKIEAAPLPVAKLKSAESSSVHKFENRKLVNIGNSCYMNSTFQALSALDNFTFRMRQVYFYLTNHKCAIVKKMSPEGQKKLDLIKLTCEILFKLNAKCKKPDGQITAVEERVLQSVREAVGSVNQNFDNSLQQDAHEFLLEYLAQIEAVIKRLSRKFYRNDYDDPETENMDQYLLNHYDFRRMCPSDTFVIKTELRIICSNCENSRTQNQGYQLDVNVTLRANKNLQELVNETFPCIYNPDVNCEECEQKGARMSSRIYTFPESFVISLKRYVASRRSSAKKIDTIVPVPKLLYTNQISEFQNDVMEFSDDEFELEEALETATSFSPTTFPMDETQQKSDEITPPPTISPVVARRRSSTSKHVDLFCSNAEEDADLYFDCDANFDGKDDQNQEPNVDQDIENGDVKMLGGADEKTGKLERKESDDCEILEEKVCMTISFAPLNDYNEIYEILSGMNIDIMEDTLRRHLEIFPKEKSEIPISTTPKSTHEVDADGNCFYRCISWLLTADEDYHKEFRKENADFIAKHSEAFSTITNHKIEGIIASVRKDSEWSSEIEIIAMCTLLKCDIYTFFCKKWVRYQPKWVDGEKRAGSLYLINKAKVHFEPVLNILAAAKPRGVKRTSSRLSDDDYNIDRSDDEMPTSRQRLSRSCKTGKTYVEGGGSTSGKMREQNQRKARVRDEVDWEAAEDSPVYVLSSVVCHQGLSLNSGHYVAYTRNASTDEWLYCSDEVVHTVSELEALTECAKKGYVFYYSKVCRP